MNRENSPIFVLLSHDVEWDKDGAPISHILARKDRFDEDILKNLERKNPYQNISEMLEIEDKFGLRSTFFFRTYVQDSKHPPPPYDVSKYRSMIRSMLSKGWEVGLHSDMTSHDSLERLTEEKNELEDTAGTKIFGNRVHFTLGKTLNTPLFHNLRKLGFKYDSSIKYEREKVTRKDFGYFSKEGITVFPITLMDALIFYYNAKSEADVLKIIRHAVNDCKRLHKKEQRIITILWHDCSLKMKYGRKYPDVLEYLTSQKNLCVKRCIDLANIIERENREGRGLR